MFEQLRSLFPQRRPSSPPQAPSPELEEVVSKLEQSAPNFNTLEEDLATKGLSKLMKEFSQTEATWRLLELHVASVIARTLGNKLITFDSPSISLNDKRYGFATGALPNQVQVVNKDHHNNTETKYDYFCVLDGAPVAFEVKSGWKLRAFVRPKYLNKKYTPLRHCFDKDPQFVMAAFKDSSLPERLADHNQFNFRNMGVRVAFFPFDRDTFNQTVSDYMHS